MWEHSVTCPRVDTSEQFYTEFTIKCLFTQQNDVIESKLWRKTRSGLFVYDVFSNGKVIYIIAQIKRSNVMKDVLKSRSLCCPDILFPGLR